MKKTVAFVMMCLVFGAFFMTSCRKSATNDSLSSIPENASMLMAINPMSLLKKADFETIKNKPEYQKMIAERAKNNPSLAAIMQDPAKSGIDLTKNIYFTTVIDPKTGESFTGAVFSIADAAKFATMAKGSVKDVEVSSKSGFSVLRGAGMFTAWNSSVAYAGNVTDSSMGEVLLAGGGKTMADNAQVQKLLTAAHDIHIWTSADALADQDDVKMGATTLGIDAKALKGNSVHSYLDFENGEVRGHADFVIQQLLRDELGIMLKDGVKTDFSRFVSDEPGITFTTALDFDGVAQFMKERGPISSLADMQAESSGFPVRFANITETLDGDILVHYVPSATNNERFLLAAKVRNMPSLNTLIAKGLKAGMLKKEAGNMYAIGGQNDVSGMYMTVVDEILVISSEKGWLTSAAAKIPLGKQPNKALTTAKTNFLSLFVSPNVKLPYNMPLQAQSLPTSEGLEAMINGKSADFRVPMTDKSKNALKAMLEAANTTTTSGGN